MRQKLIGILETEARLASNSFLKKLILQQMCFVKLETKKKQNPLNYSII